MTGDANAAILGAYDAGADEVLVNDSHWTMRNLLLEDLDRRAHLPGFQKPMRMVQGLDASYDAAVSRHQPARAGTEGGVLNHTLLGKEVQNLLLDGEPIGETRVERIGGGRAGRAGCVRGGRRQGVPGGAGGSRRGRPRPTRSRTGSKMPWSPRCLHPVVTDRESGGRGRRDAGSAAASAARARWRADLHVRAELHAASASICECIPGVVKPTPRTTEYRELAEPGDAGDRLRKLLLALQVGQQKIYS